MFVGQRPHGGDEIAAQRGIEGIDGRGPEVRGHAFEHRIARAEQQRHDRRPGRQDTRQGLRTLRPDACEAAKLGEKDLRYLFAVAGVDRRHEACQDRSLPVVRMRR